MQLHGGVLSFKRVGSVYSHKQTTEIDTNDTFVYNSYGYFTRVDDEQINGTSDNTNLEEMRAQQCGRGKRRGVRRPIWERNKLQRHLMWLTKC